MLTARAENLLWGRLDRDDTILRLQAFERSGADVLYAPGLYDLCAIPTVCNGLMKPVNVVMVMPGATFSVADLGQARVKRINVGAALTRLPCGALVDAARQMLTAGTFRFAQGAMGFARVEAFFPDPGPGRSGPIDAPRIAAALGVMDMDIGDIGVGEEAFDGILDIRAIKYIGIEHHADLVEGP